MKKIRRNTVCSECMNRSNERGKRIEAYYDNLRYEYEKKRDGWLKPNSESQPQYDEIVIRIPKGANVSAIIITSQVNARKSPFCEIDRRLEELQKILELEDCSHLCKRNQERSDYKARFRPYWRPLPSRGY